jgi:tape measure domain-containing protein
MAKIDVGLTITGVNNATGAIRGASKDVKDLGENAQATANRLKAIQVVIAGILIEKTQEWAKALVEMSIAAQSSQIRMAQFAGGAKNAQKVMGDLVESFKSAPFDIENIGDAWTKMQAQINNNAQTSNVLKAIVNDVAAVGGKDENINNLAASFQRLYGRGFASSREFVGILQQTGLTIGDLAKSAGTNANQFSRNLQNGFVSAKQFTDAFVAASKERFGDYAESLKYTVAGAWANVGNTIKEGFGAIGANTDLNATLTAALNGIANGIEAVMSSIDQTTIDKFIDWIAEMAPLAINVVRALGGIAEMVLNIGAAIANLMGIIPADALQYGIIGYALFGRTGAIIFTMLGLVDKGIRAIGDTIDQFFIDHNFFSEFFKADKIKNQKSTLQALTEAINGESKGAVNNGFADSWKKQIAEVKKKMEELQSKPFKPGLPGADMSAQAQAALEAAQAMTQKLRDDLAGGLNSIQQMNLATAGDQLGGQIADMAKKQLDFNKAVDAAALAEAKLKVHLPENVALIKQMKDSKVAFNNAVDAAIEKIKDEYYAQTLLFNLQQKQTQMAQEYSALQLKIANDSSAIAQAFQGTQAGQSALGTLDKQVQLKQQLISLETQRIQLAQQLADFDRNPNLSAQDQGRKASLEATLKSTNDLTVATQQALQNMSVQGQVIQEMWKGIGSALENDVANGLSGFLKGTMSVGDALRNIFSDLIDLSVKYLVQLAEMQLFQQAGAAAALATAGPTAAAMAALWSPAALAASIATLGAADITGASAYQAAMATSLIPFANGGVPGLPDNQVLTGPTTFGIAGEAGDEAIMPLTRIGGSWAWRRMAAAATTITSPCRPSTRSRALSSWASTSTTSTQASSTRSV